MNNNGVASLWPDTVSLVDRAVQPSGEGLEIMMNTLGALTGIGTSLAVTFFVETLANTVHLFSPNGKVYFLSKIPEIYLNHGERMARAAVDSVGIIADGHERFLSWEVQCVSILLENVAGSVRQ